MSSTNRKHIFIEAGDKRLYAIHFAGNGTKGGVVLCQPFGDEAIKARRVLFNLASAWAEEGFDVLLSDYTGTGNSSGNFEDITLESMIEDVSLFVGELVRMTKVSEVTLAGLRFGATLAAIAAERESSVNRLVLMDPVVLPLSYLREALRANLATQMMIYGKVRYKRDVLEERILKGEAVDVFGFPITKHFFESCRSVDLRTDVSGFDGRVTIIPISSLKKARISREVLELSEALEKSGAKCEVLPARERPFWTELKEYYVCADEVLKNAQLDS